MSLQSTGELACDFRDAINDIIRHYGVCVVQYPDPSPGRDIRFCGSGTLVRYEKEHFILTAAHVWREVVHTEFFALVFGRGVSRFVRRSSLYHPHWARATDFGEWGPDLALVHIPSPDTGTIGASMSFYDLSLHFPGGRRRDDEGVPADLYALLGAPAQTSDLSARPAMLKRTCFFGTHEALTCRGGFSYIDINILPSDCIDVSISFGGVSGGGLWGISLRREDLRQLTSDDIFLAGVAFYQLSIDSPVRIRSHTLRDVIGQITNNTG